MYTSTALSLALVVAAVAPVMSIPVAPQPTQSFAPLTPAELGIVPGPFATDTPEQLQQIANQIHDAWVSVNPPVPVPTTNPPPGMRQSDDLFGAIGKGAIEVPGHPFFGHGPVVLHDTEAVRRSIFGTIAKDIGKVAAKFEKGQAQAATQSALKRAPAPTPVAQPIHASPDLEELNEHEKRQLGALFGLIAKGAAKAAGKIGKNKAKDAIKSAIKRSPAPTPVAQPVYATSPGLEEHQKRQLGALFRLIGKGAAKAAGKIGKHEAKNAVKSAVNKRAPTPTPVRWAA